MEEYASLFKEFTEEAEWPNIWPEALGRVDVFFDGMQYFMSDGFHRIEAAKIVGRGSIPCRIYSGNAWDAFCHGHKANSTHGVHQTMNDKRYVVGRYLDCGIKMTQTEIAKEAGVSRWLVQDVVAERESESRIRGVVHPLLGSRGLHATVSTSVYETVTGVEPQTTTKKATIRKKTADENPTDGSGRLGASLTIPEEGVLQENPSDGSVRLGASLTLQEEGVLESNDPFLSSSDVEPAPRKGAKKYDRSSYLNQWTNAIGPLVRLVDNIADGVAEKYDPHHEKVQDLLNQATEEMTAWLQ